MAVFDEDRNELEEYVPPTNPGVILDSRLEEAVERVPEIQALQESALRDVNGVKQRIDARLEITDRNIEYLKTVQDGAMNFWILTGLTAGIVGLVQGGIALWKTFNRGKDRTKVENDVATPDAKKRRIGRSHSRDWD